jgi:mannose-6-phosphate isomerase-like protein (cupin superfamily)
MNGGRPEIIHADNTFEVPPGSSPNYNTNNPLLRVLDVVEQVQAGMGAELESYHVDSFQYVVPFNYLSLYGPSDPNRHVLAPEQQDFKTDFQKQNLRDFRLGDIQIVRGLATAGGWTGPFMRISYDAGPETPIATRAKLGDHLKLFLKVNGRRRPELIRVPYSEVNDRYEVELWGKPELGGVLDAKGRDALARGEIVAAPDLVPGSVTDFDREGKDNAYMGDVARENAMHPLWPLHVESAWADPTEKVWDSNDGKNHHHEFNMVVRGWNNYLGSGMSPNPHGGVGFLEYRNLLSNYFYPQHPPELGRDLAAHNLNAYGTKNHGNGRENFMAVDYMDLHVMLPNCGIGLHRHRDNQEIFLMMKGEGLMVVGDWAKMADRDRCFEVRTLKQGHFAMLKGGNLHGLMNALDERAELFMFGGYD